MGSTSGSVGWRARTRRSDSERLSSFGSIQNFLVYYLVQQPLAAVATVWLICFPMVYYIYGDATESAATMAVITVYFLLYLVTVIAVMILVALAIEYAFSRKARWLRRTPLTRRKGR